MRAAVVMAAVARNPTLYRMLCKATLGISNLLYSGPLIKVGGTFDFPIGFPHNFLLHPPCQPFLGHSPHQRKLVHSTVTNYQVHFSAYIRQAIFSLPLAASASSAAFCFQEYLANHSGVVQ